MYIEYVLCVRCHAISFTSIASFNLYSLFLFFGYGNWGSEVKYVAEDPTIMAEMRLEPIFSEYKAPMGAKGYTILPCPNKTLFV